MVGHRAASIVAREENVDRQRSEETDGLCYVDGLFALMVVNREVGNDACSELGKSYDHSVDVDA